MRGVMLLPLLPEQVRLPQALLSLQTPAIVRMKLRFCSSRHYRLVITGLSLPACHYRLVITGLSLPARHYRLDITGLLLPACHYRLVITGLTGNLNFAKSRKKTIFVGCLHCVVQATSIFEN